MKQFKKDFKKFADSTYLLSAVTNDSGAVEYYTFEYFIDYHDARSVETMVKNQSDLNDSIINQILDHICDNLIDHDYHYICDLLTEFLNEYPQYSDIIDYHDIIDNFDIYGNISQYERLIYDTNINVNILLNTHDDQNLMYSNNDSSAITEALINERFSEYEDLISESSISSLLYSQSITERMFYNYSISHDHTSNKFMDSLNNELMNGYKYEAVTFFTKMTVSEYLELKNAEAFRIPKNIDCGLVGFIDGSGSTLNIILQNDILLKKDQVIIEIDGSYNYGITDIYGFSDYDSYKIDIINEGSDL